MTETAYVDCDRCSAPCCRVFAVWRTRDGIETPESTTRGRWARAGARLRSVGRSPNGYRQYECLALVDASCAVYATRPTICRTYDCRDDGARYDAGGESARCELPA